MSRKLTAVLLLVSLCTAMLAGCHGQKALPAFVMPEEFDTSRPIEITFWSKNDTNKAQADVYKQAIADFTALYPNVTINNRQYTEYPKIYNDVITNIATRTTPDVCITYPDHISTYLMGKNIVVPLDALIHDPKYGLGGSELLFDGPTEEEIIPKFYEECVLEGRHYALPFMRSTEACYVNRDFVEKLGYKLPEALTWDFVWEVSEAAMKKNADGVFAVNGQRTMIPFIYKSTDNMMITMLRQKGAGYSTPEGDVQIFNDTTREILYDIAAHTKTGAFSTFKISSYPGNFLNAGQCIFAIDSTAGATWMGTSAPLHDISKDSIVDFDIEVMAIPQFDTANPQMISQGPSLCLFNKADPQEVLASWLFLQFLLTNKVQLGYSSTEGYAPVTSKAQQSKEFRDYLAKEGTDTKEHYAVKIQATKLLMANTGHTFITPVFNGSASLREAAGEMIESVAKSTRRKETVDDAYIEKLFINMTSLYKLDRMKIR